jgi:hypothetical protein
MNSLPHTFPQQLRKVQAANQDFEWYPTTDEIIKALIKDLHQCQRPDYSYSRGNSIHNGFLDIGAGNGKVLDAARRWKDNLPDEHCRHHQDVGPFYAIEKSTTLLNLLDPSIYILGCDFWNTSLHDKNVGYIFSNPPYSRFREWSAKILREAPPHTTIWLVVPQRWEKDPTLQAEIQLRNATTKIIGTFDFADAEDRKARAKVHLLRIQFPAPSSRYSDIKQEIDPFTRFFEETFTFPDEEEESTRKSFEQEIEETKVVHRLNFIEALCHLYNLRMAELHRNYQAICDISADILKEFEISRPGLIASLKMKIATAKKEYWQRLFDGMSEINSRLTHSSRKAICELMNSQTGIDFNRDNAYAIVLWVIKNANQYFDSQLISVFEDLVDKANVENYVSNQRVFKWNRFSYQYRGEVPESTHFRLKVGHRIVLQHSGGLKKIYYSCDRPGLDDRAWTTLSDIMVVANNLGFTTAEFQKQRFSTVTDSTAFEIRCLVDGNSQSATNQILMRVRAFQNGNMHIQFLPEFIHALNIQHGKLKGWLRNDDQAATELEIPKEIAAKHFQPGFRLTSSALSLMAPASEAAA